MGAAESDEEIWATITIKRGKGKWNIKSVRKDSQGRVKRKILTKNDIKQIIDIKRLSSGVLTFHLVYEKGKLVHADVEEKGKKTKIIEKGYPVRAIKSDYNRIKAVKISDEIKIWSLYRTLQKQTTLLQKFYKVIAKLSEVVKKLIS